MTIPIDAPVFEEPMDPKDVRPWSLDITRAGDPDDPFPMLEEGEDVASFTVGPSVEALALGITIKAGSGYDPTLVGDRVTFYPVVDPGSQNAAIFSGEGARIAYELTIVKNTTPPQTIQRSGGQIMRQR